MQKGRECDHVCFPEKKKQLSSAGVTSGSLSEENFTFKCLGCFFSVREELTLQMHYLTAGRTENVPGRLFHTEQWGRMSPEGQAAIGECTAG